MQEPRYEACHSGTQQLSQNEQSFGGKSIETAVVPDFVPPSKKNSRVQQLVLDSAQKMPFADGE